MVERELNSLATKLLRGVPLPPFGKDHGMTSACTKLVSKKFTIVMQVVFATATIFFTSISGVTAGWSEEKSRAEIHNKDAKEKKGILSMIKRKRDKKRLPDVEKMARNEPNSYVRHEAISTLCTLDDPRSAEILTDIALNAADDGDRAVAISGIGMVLKKEKSIPVFKKGLGDKYQKVRIRAARGLAKAGDYSGEQVLLQETQSPSPAAVGEAVEALGYVNTELSKARLKELASKTYPGHYHAKAAYRRLEYANSPKDKYFAMGKEDVVSMYPDVQRVGLEMLLNLGDPEALEVVYAIANDPKNKAFRPAREALFAQGYITEDNYWTMDLKPPQK